MAVEFICPNLGKLLRQSVALLPRCVRLCQLAFDPVECAASHPVIYVEASRLLGFRTCPPLACGLCVVPNISITEYKRRMQFSGDIRGALVINAFCFSQSFPGLENPPVVEKVRVGIQSQQYSSLSLRDACWIASMS